MHEIMKYIFKKWVILGNNAKCLPEFLDFQLKFLQFCDKAEGKWDGTPEWNDLIYGWSNYFWNLKQQKIITYHQNKNDSFIRNTTQPTYEKFDRFIQ